MQRLLPRSSFCVVLVLSFILATLTVILPGRSAVQFNAIRRKRPIGFVFSNLSTESKREPSDTPTPRNIHGSSSAKSEDDELREEWRLIVARMPEVETRLHRLLIYHDGIVAYLTVINHAKVALKVSFIRESLSLRGDIYKDDMNGVWYIPDLTSHYLFVPDSKANTTEIEPKKSAALRLIDRIEKPTLKSAEGCQPKNDIERPLSLRYDMKWISTLQQARRGTPSVNVRRVGKGIVKVEWIDKCVPKSIHSGVIEALSK